LSEFFNIGSWLSKKMEYHRISNHNSVKRKQVNQGEIWDCDLGFNIGEEKNKKRPVVVVSNNSANRTGKIVVAPITDARGKVNPTGLPQHNTWYLLLSDTTDDNKMHTPNRRVPKSAIQYSFITKDSIIQCEELRSLSKARLVGVKKGNLDPADLDRLKNKLKKVFDIL
jgi:mRNA interferase MazF